MQIQVLLPGSPMLGCDGIEYESDKLLSLSGAQALVRHAQVAAARLNEFTAAMFVGSQIFLGKA